MQVLNISEVRKNFAAVVDAVIDNAEECVIPRSGGTGVVIVSLEEWNRMQETFHVMGTRENLKHLIASIEDVEAGRVIEVDPDTLEPIGQVYAPKAA
jgi:antitoxin YefM